MTGHESPGRRLGDSALSPASPQLILPKPLSSLLCTQPVTWNQTPGRSGSPRAHRRLDGACGGDGAHPAAPSARRAKAGALAPKRGVGGRATSRATPPGTTFRGGASAGPTQARPPPSYDGDRVLRCADATDVPHLVSRKTLASGLTGRMASCPLPPLTVSALPVFSNFRGRTPPHPHPEALPLPQGLPEGGLVLPSTRPPSHEGDTLSACLRTFNKRPDAPHGFQAVFC